MTYDERELMRMETATNEATRFIDRAKVHARQLRADPNSSGPMQTRAAMKRAALDLKLALCEIHKSRYE